MHYSTQLDSHSQVIHADTKPSANPQSLRLYQVWKGSNIFFLGGRLIFGPDARSLFLALSLILIPSILFCVFVSQTLMDEIPHHSGNLILAICVVFTFFVIVLLFLTSGRDPGIIPRNLHPPEIEDEGDFSCISSDWPGSQRSMAPNIPSTKEVIVNGTRVKVKYCHTCLLYRPPRCSHCSICNNCVERFDHHCPWLGQCIGRRNYRYFFTFVFSTTILCLYVFAFCWVNIKKLMDKHHCDLWMAFRKSPVSVILILYTFLAAWFVGGLTAFHLYLIFTNQTTYENFRYQYDRKLNPYNRGCINNVMEIFFSKIPKSKNNFREKVSSELSSVCTSSRSIGLDMASDLARSSLSVETGKRKGVTAQDFDDIQSQAESIGSLERCRTQPRHTNWEMIPDLRLLSAPGFDLEYGLTGRQKIHDSHQIMKR